MIRQIKKHHSFYFILMLIIIFYFIFIGGNCNSPVDPIENFGHVFNHSVTPASISIKQNDTGYVSLAVNNLQPDTATVRLTLIDTSSVPFILYDLDYNFSPKVINESDTSILSIFVPITVKPDTYNILVKFSVTGSLPGDYKTSDLRIIVLENTEDFSFSLPTSFDLVQGRSINFTTTVNRTGGHSRNINLSLLYLPSNVSYSFDPNPLPGNENTSELTITAGASAVPGEYPPVVRGNDGLFERFMEFALFVIEPYKISLSVDSLSIVQGQIDSVQVILNKIDGFSDAIHLTVEGTILGQNAGQVDSTFNPNPVVQDSTSQLILIVGQSVIPGSYPLTVKGTVGNMVKSAELELVVP